MTPGLRIRRLISQDAALTFLLVLLVLLLFILYPLLGSIPSMSLLLELTLSVVLLVAGAATLRLRRLYVVSVILVAAALTAQWLDFAVTIPEGVAALAMILFMLFALVGILSRTLAPGPVTVHHVSGSLAAYLLLGIIWAYGYAAMERTHPESFNLVASSVDSTGEAMRQMLYFSFVTLSTLGYGDVTPLTRSARMLAVGEAIIGQMFLVVLVARLVSQWGRTPDRAAEAERDV